MSKLYHGNALDNLYSSIRYRFENQDNAERWLKNRIIGTTFTVEINGETYRSTKVITNEIFLHIWLNVFTHKSAHHICKLIYSKDMVQQNNAIKIFLYHFINKKCSEIINEKTENMLIDGNVLKFRKCSLLSNTV